MRTVQHIIDTRSIKRVLNILPDHWVIRELTERDYGIDLVIEVFEKNNKDKNDRDVFVSTGAIFHAQVKGTNSALKVDENNNISFSLDKGGLLYTERFSTPFLLFRVDVSSDNADSYFVWIQRYVRDVLDLTTPGWRTSGQNSFTIKIPEHNNISSSFEKIERIASWPRLIQEIMEFHESYFHLSSQLKNAALGDYNINKDSLAHMVTLARRIKNLQTIYKYNHCCITKSCAEELLSFVQSLNVSSVPSNFSNIPHQQNLDLLASSIHSLLDSEDFIAENECNTVY
ncbi:DUF4365 domain-containing protein [Serratia grimesii]|uniref:DUF4365 domain-containing protein n=1 Tax=Serratia grimesii TaxID=82995 RepID=UPI00223F550B|nr:DUF4365 domain-containing protein [Serratia grimesii]